MFRTASFANLSDFLALCSLSELECLATSGAQSGSCQFAALSHQLLLGQVCCRNHGDILLRNIAIKTIHANPEMYEHFLLPPDCRTRLQERQTVDLRQYLEQMANLNTFGDNVTLQAISDSLGCKITIVKWNPTGTLVLITITPRRLFRSPLTAVEKCLRAPNRHLWLTLYGDFHFRSLIAQPSQRSRPLLGISRLSDATTSPAVSKFQPIPLPLPQPSSPEESIDEMIPSSICVNLVDDHYSSPRLPMENGQEEEMDVVVEEIGAETPSPPAREEETAEDEKTPPINRSHDPTGTPTRRSITRRLSTLKPLKLLPFSIPTKDDVEKVLLEAMVCPTHCTPFALTVSPSAGQELLAVLPERAGVVQPFLLPTEVDPTWKFLEASIFQ